MWFLWILITLFVLWLSGTQVFSFFHILFNYPDEYNNLTPQKRSSMSTGVFLHSIIMITWIILCFTIEDIRRYGLVLFFAWLIGICFTTYNVNKNVDIILSDLSDDTPKEQNVNMDEVKNVVNNLLDTTLKIQRIKNEPGRTEEFTLGEIVSGLINLIEAKENLSKWEYETVLLFFKKYQRYDKKYTLDHFGFFKLSMKIIATFDLIAPYYLYSGQEETDFMQERQDEKYEYRWRAKQLLEQPPSNFTEEWNSLRTAFMNEFYFMEFLEREI